MPRLSAERRNTQVKPVESADGAEDHNAGIGIGTGKNLRQVRIDRSLDNLRRTRAGRLAVRIAITVAGAAVIALGLVLVPLPGPGWLIVFAGLAIWSLEFRWAKRLNVYVRARVSAWTTWYAQQNWPMRIAVGAITVVFVVAIIGAATYLSLGPAPFRWAGIG